METLVASAVPGVSAAAGLAAVLYLGTPQQQWRPMPLAPRITLVLAVVFGGGSILLLRRVLGAAETIYATILVVTIVTTVLPFLAAAFGRNRGRDAK